MVEVTVGQMRAADCIHDLYLAEKNLAEARGVIIAEYEARFSDILSEVRSLGMADALLGTATRFLKVAGTTAIVVFTAGALISMVSEIISWSR